MTAPYKPEPTAGGSWMDPPAKPRHTCAPYYPALTEQDYGRRWRCSCGRVYRVEQSDQPGEQGQLYLRALP